MPGRYAATTAVDVERSQAEIRKTLKRYGAEALGYGEDERVNAAMVVFRLADRHYRVYVPLPDRADPQWRATVTTPTIRAGAFRQAAYDQAMKQRWRAAALYIKAVLEAAESGIISVEQALLTHLLLPNGQTMGQATATPIEEMYQSGQMQPLLPGLSQAQLPTGRNTEAM